MLYHPIFANNWQYKIFRFGELILLRKLMETAYGWKVVEAFLIVQALHLVQVVGEQKIF